MLETIREYAEDRLEESGQSDGWRARHAAYFLALAEELEPPPMGGSEKDFARLRPETDNLRAAVELYSGEPDPSNELRLVGTLFRFWPTVSLVSEGGRVAEHALTRSRVADPSLRLKVLYAASLCAFYRADFELAARYEGERLELARVLGDARSEAVALNDLAIIAMDRQDVNTAADLLEHGAAIALEVGDEQLLVSISNNLGELALQRGEYGRARELLEGLLASDHLVEDWSTAHVLESLGYALLAVGEPKLAATRFREGLALLDVNPAIGSYCLDGLAAVAGAHEDVTWAGRLSGAADAMRERTGLLGGWLEKDVAERTARAGRDAVGEEEWEAYFAAGATMTLESLLDYARTLE